MYLTSLPQFPVFFPSSLLSLYLLTPLLFSSIPLSFLFRKEQVSLEYQQNMSYQVTVRLSTSLCITAEQGDPIRGTGFQKPVKELETVPVPDARSPTRSPSYTTVTYMQRAYISPMQSPWLLTHSR